LDLNLLSVGGTPAAFAYNYHYQGYVFGLRTGTDRSAGSGAGTVLMQKAIGDSFTRGDHTYDLGAEYLESKRHWLTHVKPVYSYRHYPTTAARAQVLRLAHAAGRWIGTGAGRSALGKGA
jgi:CelD/BcsL family acetyltransferase involved in cellulose biosynthesis